MRLQKRGIIMLGRMLVRQILRPSTRQRALMRLTEAESQALSMSTNLLRVHDELSNLARVHAGSDTGLPTVVPAHAVTPAPLVAVSEVA
mgnify:CR=1 FL=1